MVSVDPWGRNGMGRIYTSFIKPTEMFRAIVFAYLGTVGANTCTTGLNGGACQNGGTVSGTVPVGCSCSCVNGFVGEFCQTKREGPYTPNTALELKWAATEFCDRIWEPLTGALNTYTEILITHANGSQFTREPTVSDSYMNTYENIVFNLAGQDLLNHMSGPPPPPPACTSLGAHPTATSIDFRFVPMSDGPICCPKMVSSPQCTYVDDDINTWDVTQISNLDGIFSYYKSGYGYICSDLSSSLSNWETGQVTSMNEIFTRDTYAGIPYGLEDWNTSNVLSMDGAFRRTYSTPTTGQSINAWDIGNVRSLVETFAGTGNLHNINVSEWDTSQVTTMKELFLGVTGQYPSTISGWNTSKVLSMQGAFMSSVDGVTIDLTAWDFGSVTDASFMFFNSEFNTDVGNWNTGSVRTMDSMFETSSFNHASINAWNVGQVTSTKNMFSNMVSHFNHDLNGWQPTSLSDASAMFRSNIAFNSDLNGWQTTSLSDTSNMFNGASSFNSDLNGWQTTSLVDPSAMFMNADTFNGNISGWNTSGVTKLSQTFYGTDVFNADLNRWNTGAVTHFDGTFESAHAFNAPVSDWDTSSAVDFSYMFYGTDVFDQDLNGWNTTSVTTIDQAFRLAGKFNSDLNGWQTSRVKTMDGLFRGAERFNGDISAWDTSQVTSMDGLFQDAVRFNGDISAWDTSQVTSMTNIFDGAYRFEGDISKWDTSSVSGGFVIPCFAGKYRAANNTCVACADGTYVPGHLATVSTSGCYNHSTCPEDQFVLMAGTASMNTLCANRNHSDHCEDGQFIVGHGTTNTTGTWVLNCTAAGHYSCPWSSSGPDNTHALVLSEAATPAVLAAAQNAHKDIHSITDTELPIHTTYVLVCDTKRPCLHADNQYVFADNGKIGNRECANCPHLCPGFPNPRADSCPGDTINNIDDECLVATTDNQNYCCRMDYDRTLQELASNSYCTEQNAQGCLPESLTLRNKTTTSTVTSTTTSTAISCGVGERRIAADNTCEDCPAGQFQNAGSHSHIKCREKSTCGPGEVAMTYFDSSITTDIRCVTTASSCGLAEYEILNDHDLDVNHPLGSFALSCSHLSAVIPYFDESTCSGNAYHGIHTVNISYNPHDNQFEVTHIGVPTGYANNIPYVRVCAPWKTCRAENNEYVATHGTTTSNRECLECPMVADGCTLPSSYECNYEMSASTGTVTSDVKDGPECTGVNRDNQDHCCRKAYDRSLHAWTGISTSATNICDQFDFSSAFRCDADLWSNGLVPIVSTETTTTVSSTTLTEITTTESGDLVGIIALPEKAKESKTTRGIAIAIFVMGVIGLLFLFFVHARGHEDGEYSRVPPSMVSQRKARVGAKIGKLQV